MAAQWVKSNVNPRLLEKDSVSILSVGSGTGDFDFMILDSLIRERAKKINYFAVEPSITHATKLETRLCEAFGDEITSKVVPTGFESASLIDKFDVIVFAHSLYYIQDREVAIERAFDLLAGNGQILVVHQTPIGIAQIQKKFMLRLAGA